MNAALQAQAADARARGLAEAQRQARERLLTDQLERGPFELPAGWRVGLWGLGLLGLLSICAGWVVGQPGWSIAALLVACLILLAVSQVGIVWSAIIELTHSRWGRSYRRLMELSIAATPLALFGLLGLLVSSPWWAPFADLELPGGKGVWLSLPFWAIRNFAAVLALFLLSLVYLGHCLRPDLGLAAARGRAFPGRLAAWLARGFGDLQVEVEHAARRRALLAPILCLGFALSHSMLGFDLVMALDVWWYSTLFGAYHFIGSVYLGLAVTILAAVALKGPIGQPRLFSAKHFGIIGSVLFAFCFLMGDFFWSQFLTIYYADLSEETGYLLLRTMDTDLPYHFLAWAVLAGFFGIPFLSLIFRAVKWVPGRLAVVAGIVVLAMIAERFLCAAPPLLGLEPGAGLDELLAPLSMAVLGSVGLLALGCLAAGRLMRSVPLLPISDPLLVDSFQDTAERPR